MRDDVISQTLKLGFTLPCFRETLKILGNVTCEAYSLDKDINLLLDIMLSKCNRCIAIAMNLMKY